MVQRPQLRLNREPAEAPEPSTTPARRKATKSASPSPKTQASREGTKFIGGHFPKSIWDTFRKLGIDLEKSGQELLQEAIDDLFSKHKKR
jgi:hypothetical protein